MSVDLIRYDLLVQDALRGVVRRVLTDVTQDGLPGDHHLYVSFDTRAPGVRLSPRLKEKYPEEMTIVLQHQFWDLIVTEQFFEVGLSFGGIPERLHVPFEALKGFFDPSVKFGLQFEPAATEEDDEDETVESGPTHNGPAEVTNLPVARPTSVPTTRSTSVEGGERAEAKPRPAPAAVKADGGKVEKADAAKPEAAGTEASRPATAKSNAPKADAPKTDAPKTEAPKAEPAEAGEASQPDGGAQVVRLDAFRKK